MKIPTLEGAREAVLSAIEGDGSITASTRAFLCEQVRAIPQEFNGVKLVGHINETGTMRNVHVTISGRKLTR